ncbi:MAG: hypothetical protein ACP5K5_00070 [Candidatus Micrarchaeia archaeon]
MLLAIFLAVAALELISIIVIFVFKNVLHSIIMLAVAFVISSVLFAAMQQPLLALLQLFIVVGTILTYFFIGVASAGISRFKHTSYTLLAILSITMFMVLAYMSNGVNFTGQNMLTKADIVNYVSGSIWLIYFLTLVLFSVGLSGIILLKRLGER